jgi:serine/arginine repetitive matrix protein 1
MSRVKLDVLKPWIGQRVANFLNGIEDDVVVEFVFNQLEDKDPDPRKMQINLVNKKAVSLGCYVRLVPSADL